MAVFLIAITMILMFPTEGMQEFSRHSNGIAEYEFVTVKPCDAGLKRSGYALMPFDSLVLKQRNADGTITEPTCTN